MAVSDRVTHAALEGQMSSFVERFEMHSTQRTGIRRIFMTVLGLIGLLSVGASVRANGTQDYFDRSFDHLRVIGLTDDGRLVRFKAGAPYKTREIGWVTGFTGSDTALVGIDYRVQDGKLYGVGNGGGVYTIDTTTAAATFVNALTVPLNGTIFGVDFNPAADRLRIVSNTGQNLAHNVNAGGVTVANATLTYTAPPAAPVTALGVTGAAYTNNDSGQADTATTLFDVDTTLDQIVIQSPPGNGILVATGKLGFDAGPSAGADIYSRLVRGVTVSNHAFATLSVNGRYAFYQIRLTTGRAYRMGGFYDAVVDIAIPLNQ
jgi:hypothetical protein